MLLTKSLTSCSNTLYNRGCRFMWVLTYGFFLSEAIKRVIVTGTPPPTAIESFYDLLNMLAYSVCIYHLCGLQGASNYHIDSIIYIVPYTISIIAFMYLGEIEWLTHFVIEWGFWKELNMEAIFFLIIMSVCMICLIIRQYMRGEGSLASCMCFIFVYLCGWFMIDCVAGATYILHIHHAYLALFLSIVFSQWTNMLTVVMHAICMGVWTEGMNVIGTQELEIFIEDRLNRQYIDDRSSVILLGICIGTGILSVLYNVYISDMITI